MESLNSVDSLNNQIDNIDRNAAKLKNKNVENNVVQVKDEDILATAPFSPEEEGAEYSPEEGLVKKLIAKIESKMEVDGSNESIVKSASRESINLVKNDDDNVEKKENQLKNVTNISNSLTEVTVNESNDATNTDVNEEDLTKKSLEIDSNNDNIKKEEEVKEVKDEVKEEEVKEEEAKEVKEVEEEEEDIKEEEVKEIQENKEEIKEIKIIENVEEKVKAEEVKIENEKDVKYKSYIPNASIIKMNSSIGGSDTNIVNKFIDDIKKSQGVQLGSMDSISRKKLQMNKKFQELRDSQANLNKVMSTDEPLAMKSAKGLSDEAVNKLKKSKESLDDEYESSDEETQSENDEVFNVELIRKFEKRNTIHIPMHNNNYANINSSYFTPEFDEISIDKGIKHIVNELFEIIEENIKPIMQADGLSKLFIKNTSSKEEDTSDFDITVISDEVGQLVENQQYEEAYKLIVLKVNNNYRVQICEEILTTINSIVVLFCLNERIQNAFRSYFTEHYSEFKRNSLLEIMNTVDIISPPEQILLAYCAYYLVHSKNKKLAPEVYKELSAALSKNQDYNYSLSLLNDMGRQHWTKVTYQNALDLCIKMKPQKIRLR